ncbi:MAG: sugar phosphate isomerase/epimerase [bacterium]|nr:sugar phosphate isomerase/epimerase [bacterium]
MGTSDPSSLERRRFLGVAGAAAAAPLLASAPMSACSMLGDPGPLFRISLAEWSLHKALFSKKLDNLAFPQKARQLGIDAIEYVKAFFKDKARDSEYLAELNKRCLGEGVQSLLIMCDGEGALGDPDSKKRAQAVTNHHKWVEAAKVLGCHSIRVNAQSRGSFEEQQKLAADGLRQLCEYGDGLGINVIVENHGGLSSNGKWLSGTLKMVEHPRVGSLPDFGNFRVRKGEMYDRYQGTDELMPFAKGVSAKSHDFDEAGNEIHTDYRRMLDVVVQQHGWRGYIGIEYEGKKLDEDAGILATKALLETVRSEMEQKT